MKVTRWKRTATPGAEDGDPGHLEIPVLRPDRRRPREGEGHDRPVVRIAGGHAPPRLGAVLGVAVLGDPLDRKEPEGAQDEIGVEPATLDKRGQVLADLAAHRLGRQATRSPRIAQHEAGAPADQRRQKDVGVSDDDGGQRNRRAPPPR